MRTHSRYLGCPSSWLSNGRRDPGCYMGYGVDEGWLDIPNDNYYTAYAGYPWAGGTASSYCPDSWRGDGYCDACIVAKYGYDALPGSTQVHDCVYETAGNWCSDIVYDAKDNHYQTLGFYMNH